MVLALDAATESVEPSMVLDSTTAVLIGSAVRLVVLGGDTDTLLEVARVTSWAVRTGADVVVWWVTHRPDDPTAPTHIHQLAIGYGEVAARRRPVSVSDTGAITWAGDWEWDAVGPDFGIAVAVGWTQQPSDLAALGAHIHDHHQVIS